MSRRDPLGLSWEDPRSYWQSDAGRAEIAGKIYITEKPWHENFENKDGSYSLYDNRRHNPNSIFHEQILSAKVTSPNASLKNRKLTLGSYKIIFITGGWEWKHVDLSLLDFGSAKVAAGIHEGKLEVTALATIWDPSITFKIGGCKISLTANLGSIGGDFNLGTKSFKTAAAYGWGAGISIDWE